MEVQMATHRLRNAHLVGSVGLGGADEVFRAVAAILGPCCGRIPDGETGERGYWIRWQEKTFANATGLEKVEQEIKLPGFKDSMKRYFYRLPKGTDGSAVVIGELGYAAQALKSWEQFRHLQGEGVINADARFQVSLPTPTALVSGFVLIDARGAIEAKVEARMLEDLAAIQAAIPHNRLTIQWDVCYEVVDAEDAGGPILHYAPAIEGSVKRLERLITPVASGVELGIHLCYGDPGHQHIVQPRDFTVSVAFANAICGAAKRVVDYIHMPVPRDRTDDAYFAPLADLNLPDKTRLILGLVHLTDGEQGGRARMAAANSYTRAYDIATECGFGRRDPDTIADLLKLHRTLCES
jgi:hypothetical protein